MSPIKDRFTFKALLLFTCLVVASLALAACGSRQERAQSYYEHAKSYFDKKDFAKARIELKNALQLNGDMVEAWRTLAQIDEQERNWQALAGTYRKIAELDPKDAAARIALARIYLLAGSFDNALKTADAAGEIDPKNPAILALKGAVLFRLKDTDGAMRAAQNALEIDPGNVDANVVVAMVKYSKGDSDGALKSLANVTDAHKDDLGVLFLAINIFERQGNVQQAESLLRKLMTLYPNEPGFRAQLIKFLIAHNRQDDAVKELRAAVAANQNDANSEVALVNLLGALKGPAAAREELVTRINAGGDVFSYQVLLAKFDFEHGNSADSTKLLQQLIANKSSSPRNVLTAQSTLAEMYLSRRDVAAAEPLITDILRVDSRNIDGLRLRASIRINRGQFDDAIADLRSALNDQPQSPVLLSSLALAYERSGSIALADKAFFDATKASGFAPAVGLNYIGFLQRRGLSAQSENVLTELAQRNPNSIPVLSALAKAKLASQDWAGARAVADAIHRLGDKGDIADQIVGAAFSGQKKFSDSIAVLQSSYDANPTATQPMAALVRVYIQSKQVDRAEAFVKAVLVANPKNAEALVLMGAVQLAKNDPKQAQKSFQTAIDVQPKDIVGYRALADFYIRQNKSDEALNIVQAGLQQQPKSFALHLTLAGLLEVKKQYEPAISEYESMLKDEPGSMIVANNLASLLTDHRSDKASMERANTLAVLLKSSQVPQFKDTVGWVNYQRGDYTAATSLLESAATELPNTSLIHYHLGMTYLATGQDEKASQQFKKASDLAPNDAELKMKIDAALNSHSEKKKS